MEESKPSLGLFFISLSLLFFAGVLVFLSWQRYQTIEKVIPDGSRIAGIPGAIAASLGSIAPACVITMLLIFLLHKYRKLDIINEVLYAVRCMAVGLILVTILRMSGTIFLMNGISFQIDYLLLFMTAAAFIIIYKWQVSPLLVMIICGALEVSVSYLMKMFF